MKAVDTVLNKAKVNEIVYKHIVEYLLDGFKKFGFDNVINYIVLLFSKGGDEFCGVDGYSFAQPRIGAGNRSLGKFFQSRTLRCADKSPLETLYRSCSWAARRRSRTRRSEPKCRRKTKRRGDPPRTPLARGARVSAPRISHRAVASQNTQANSPAGHWSSGPQPCRFVDCVRPCARSAQPSVVFARALARSADASDRAFSGVAAR